MKGHSFINKITLSGFLIYAFLIVFAASCLIPMLWVLINAFKDNTQILMDPFGLPQRFKFENLATAWVQASIGKFFLNTVVVSFGAVALLLILSAMVSYVLARVINNTWLYAFFTLGIMLPTHTVLIPEFVIINNLKLANSLQSLIIIYVALNMSFSFFILYGFMKGIPKEMEESAYIDGCSRTVSFFRIVLPLTKPGLATVGVLTFLNCWNEYLIPLVMMNKMDRRLLSQGIAQLKGMFTIDYGVMCSAILIASVPTILIYILFQEQVIKGMTAGAVKG